MDGCGLLPESKLWRFKYAMVLVDASTRFKMGNTDALARLGRRAHQTLHRALQLASRT